MQRRGVVDVLLCAVVVLLVASCSGGGTGRSGGTAAPATSSSSTTTAVIPPSSIASTTTVTTTSTSTSTTSTTTTTTTTLAAPTLDDLEAEVAAAYDEVYEGYWACLRSPLDCDTSWLVEGSGSAEAMQATMQALADRARYVGDDPVGYYVIESIEFDDTLTEATVTSCWWSTAVLYTTPIDPNRPPGPDNPPTVVNDIPGSGMQNDVLALVGREWRSNAGQLLDAGSLADVCGGDTR